MRLLKEDPAKALEELGVTYNDLLETAMRNAMVFGRGELYISPDEILYGKTKLKKLKKTKLGKLLF